MLGFVRDVRSEIAPNYAVPGWVVLLVELLLNVGGNALLDVILLKSLRTKRDEERETRKSAIHGIEAKGNSFVSSFRQKLESFF